MGQAILIPCSSWHFEGGDDPATWRVRTTSYGPSSSTTENLPFSSVIFAKWGSTPGQNFVGIGPTRWAHTTARLQSEVERSLADESGGPLASLLAIPVDGGDGSDADPLKDLKSDIRSARGKALLLETTAANWGEGKEGAPRSDWKAARLGQIFRQRWQRYKRNLLVLCWPRAGFHQAYLSTRRMEQPKGKPCEDSTWVRLYLWPKCLSTNYPRN